MNVLAWLGSRFCPAPSHHGPSEVPTSSTEDRIMAERRNEEAATIRLRMLARVQLLDSEAALVLHEDVGPDKGD